MKNILDKKFYVMLLGLLFFAPACTDLEEELYSDVTDENFFQTDDEFISALGGAYSSFYGIGNHSNLWSSNELSSDELVVTHKGGDWYDGGILLALHDHSWTPDNGFFNNTWGFLYGGINTCNRLIAQFGALDNENSAAYVNKLRAIRAIWYMWAMDAFGNVPLVVGFSDDVPKNDANFQTGRTNVYNFVASELTEVVTTLDAQVGGNAYARVNQATAYAALAKLYLNAEVYTGTPKWTEAKAAVDAIEAFGTYSLAGDYKSNFSIENSGSTENIFVVPYDKVFAGGFNWVMMTLAYPSANVFELTEQPWNGYSTVEEFYNSYIDTLNNPGPVVAQWRGLAEFDPAGDLRTPNGRGTNDLRISNFLVGPQLTPAGTIAEDPAFDADDPDGTGLNFTPAINEIQPNGHRQAGARIGKYAYEQGGTANMSNDFVVFRWGDMKLVRAEANHRLGNSAAALAEVNEIRARAGVTAFTTLTDENLLAERGREMFAELSRRQDLIRFGKFTEGASWWAKESSDAKYNVFPIPQPQIDVNSTLTQNPGY